MTRASQMKAADHPGTLVRGNSRLCITCYAGTRLPSTSTGRAAPKSIVLASISERFPQNTDCRPSCCKTPFGHSTVRDRLPASHPHACHCHREVS